MNEAQIEVSTPRRWLGNPRFGTFVLFLDGQKAGLLPPRGTARLACEAGEHQLTARMWWYSSRPFALNLAPDEEVRLVVDIIREGSLISRMLYLMVVPWRGVTVAAAA